MADLSTDERLAQIRELAEKSPHDGKDAAESLLALPSLLTLLDEQKKRIEELERGFTVKHMTALRNAIAATDPNIIDDDDLVAQPAKLQARASRAEQALKEAVAQRDGFIAAIDLLIDAWDKTLLAANLKPRQLTSENLIDLIDEYRAIGQNWKARAEAAESALSTERERVIQVVREFDGFGDTDDSDRLVERIRALSSLPTPPEEEKA